VVNAVIMDGQQPVCGSALLHAAWLGSVPYGTNTTAWREPVAVPWSVPLPAGISRFEARPEWAPAISEIFPAVIEFTAVAESSKVRFGPDTLRIEGVPDNFEPFPPGTPVGRLRILEWTNLADRPLVLPSAWLIERFWMKYEPRPTNWAPVAIAYLVRGRVAPASFEHQTISTTTGLTFVVDHRRATNGMNVAVSYTLSNASFLSPDDPRFDVLFAEQADLYIKNVKVRAQRPGGSAKWARAFLLLLLAVPAVCWALKGRRGKGVTNHGNRTLGHL